MAKELPPPARLEFLPSLYHAGLEEALAALASVEDDELSDEGRGVVMLLGHNPGWEDLVSAATGVTTQMKTACAALLRGDAGSYRQALAGQLALEALLAPK